jgi:hypothetical protein
VKSGEFDDPTQAEMHLAVARQSQWKELHYYTPDGTDAEFSQRTKEVLARATDVRTRPVAAVPLICYPLSER